MPPMDTMSHPKTPPMKLTVKTRNTASPQLCCQVVSCPPAPPPPHATHQNNAIPRHSTKGTHRKERHTPCPHLCCEVCATINAPPPPSCATQQNLLATFPSHSNSPSRTPHSLPSALLSGMCCAPRCQSRLPTAGPRTTPDSNIHKQQQRQIKIEIASHGSTDVSLCVLYRCHM